MSSATDSTADQTTHHLHHDWAEKELASNQIVQAIAEYENEESQNLPPLRDSINPKALDTAFESDGRPVSKAGCITFSYYGYTVLVQSTGQILIKKN
ncbi:HalOD1 output domain-containing protein [Natronorubrum thiooxidans]|nr:HalOD1 output domain-containing protein [Natronorubrum thiooxidans]